MRSKGLSLVMGAALAAVLCMVLLLRSDQAQLIAEVRHVLLLNQERQHMEQKSAAWVDAMCITRQVITTRNIDESLDAFCARHDEAVAKGLLLYGIKEDQDAQTTWLGWFLKQRPELLDIKRPHYQGLAGR